jgi:hypothetical protein
MVRGLYFEYHCLGSNAHSNGEVPVLTTLASGKKSADHIRIDEQIIRFNEMFDPAHEDFLGHEITHRQLFLKGSFDETPVEGTLDFVSVHNGVHYVNDLKLTSDINGYWAETQTMDHTQAITYSWLYEQNFGVKPVFRYWVFDYSPRKNIKFVDVEATEATFSEIMRSYVVADTHLESLLADYEEMPATPSPEQCSRCRVVDCSERVIKSKIKYEKVVI